MNIKFQVSVLASILLMSFSITAQKLDSLVYESTTIRIMTNAESDVYEISNMNSGESIKELKFVKRIARTFQVLDSNNEIFYINEDFQITDSIVDHFWMCGTVPHYSMKVEEIDDKYFVMSDETFYDHGNEIPAEEHLSVEKSQADKVIFVNGESEFMYTSNFGYGICSVNPEWLFLVKNNKFASQHNPSLIYDSIDFTNYSHSLITKKDGLYGVFGIVEPKYSEIQAFDYYLAKATLPNGREVVIDLEGGEY